MLTADVDIVDIEIFYDILMAAKSPSVFGHKRKERVMADYSGAVAGDEGEDEIEVGDIVETDDLEAAGWVDTGRMERLCEVWEKEGDRLFWDPDTGKVIKIE